MSSVPHLVSHRSWLPSANDPATDFPLTNLPWCVFLTGGEHHIGIGLGDQVLDLHTAPMAGKPAALLEPTLNALMACDSTTLADLRSTLQHLLHESASAAVRQTLAPHLHPIAGARFVLPARIGDYTDFYASLHHATNVGRLFRPDQPLLPNYKYVPIGYHGRASSIRISGEPVRRPSGQLKPADAPAPHFAPTQQLDFELELAAFIRGGNPLGEPIPIAHAEDHLFGFTLLNDWSARDIQSWEYQPLGPFLGKSFHTTLSPWIVPAAALEPFRIPTPPRPAGDPEPLTYLANPHPNRSFDICGEAYLSTSLMRKSSVALHPLNRTSASHLYWTFAQLIAHHTSNGCNLQPADLLASGTISGPGPDELGSLLEITRRGAQPLTLPTGERRAFLEDGDEILLSAHCQREGHPRIGFGECRAQITAS